MTDNLPNEDIFRGYGVEVQLTDPQNFLKVKETLTRIGIASKKDKTLYQSCLPGNSRILTENGSKTIKEIVDTNYTGKVLSINKDGIFEWNSVLAHHVKDNIDKKWVDIIGTKMVSAKRLICTDDHLVGIVSDCFNPIIEFLPAKECLGKFLVRNPVHTSNKMHNISAIFNKEQLEFLIGTILGDGCVTKNGGIQINHCLKQKNYLIEKQFLFHGSNIREGENTSFRNEGKKFPIFCFNIKSNQQSKKLRELMYIDGKKTIKNILHLITDKSLCYWYLDDGNLSAVKIKNGYSYFAELNTQGFSYEDHLLLIDMFKNKFNITCKIVEQKVDYKGTEKKYLKLRFDSINSKMLFSLISKYVCDDMKYKIPPEYWSEEQYHFNNKNLEYALQEIKEIKYINESFNPKYLSSKLYDIEVENAHNFIANDSLVHNCHLLHKRGRYAIIHFKELFGLDGHEITFDEDDLARRNTIANLLEDWGLVRILDQNKTEEPVALMSSIKVVKFAEKKDWVLKEKYTVGIKKY